MKQVCGAVLIKAISSVQCSSVRGYQLSQARRCGRSRWMRVRIRLRADKQIRHSRLAAHHKQRSDWPGNETSDSVRGEL